MTQVCGALAAHVGAVEDGKAAFKERCEFIRAHGTVPDEASHGPGASESAAAADAAGHGEVAQGLPRNPGVGAVHERRGQRFAALGVLNIAGASLVLPLGARDTDEACRAWIQDTLADRYPMFDIMCVQMYEWVYPHTLRDRQCSAAIPFMYGGAEGKRLTELMQYQVDEEKKMEELTATMQANGVDEDRYVTELVA